MSNTMSGIDFQALFQSAPALFLVLKPNDTSFTIIDASNAYLSATMTERSKIIGKDLFEVFPDNPEDPSADGSRNLKRSLEKVRTEKIPDGMSIQKYDIQRPESQGGGFEERYWNPYNFPVLNDQKQVAYIIHRVEDVTDVERMKKRTESEKKNLLDELDVKTRYIQSNQKRVDAILEAVLKYTVLDFSEKLEVSSKGDELDAIAVGLNTLSDELETHIRQLKESEERVLASEKIFSTVFYQSPVMNAITDAKTGEFIEVNENFTEFIGYKKEEILGRTSIELNLMPDVATRERIASEMEKSGYSRDVLLEVLTKEKMRKWVSFSAHAVTMAGRYCFIKAMVDITERKHAEEQLLAVNKELESFSYSVSHDLRAPLRAVSGYAQMMHEDYGSKLDDEGRRVLDAIKYNAAKMGTLIDDLLAFSRLGRKEVMKTEINMNELLEGVMIDMNKSVTHKARLKIGKLHSVKADYGLLHQVVYNLVSNALKYSSKKEKPVVEISSREEGQEIIFSVKDNGAGFDMKYANKLFGVFQRLHAQSEFEGTGVGLAIVQRIISKHGGRVWAQAEPGKGATFYFSLTKT